MTDPESAILKIEKAVRPQDLFSNGDSAREYHRLAKLVFPPLVGELDRYPQRPAKNGFPHSCWNREEILQNRVMVMGKASLVAGLVYRDEGI